MARSTSTTAAAGRARTRERPGSGERRAANPEPRSGGPGKRRGHTRGGRRRNPNRWRFYVLLVLLGLILAVVVWFTVGREAFSSFMDQRGQQGTEQTETGADEDGDAGGSDDGGSADGGADGEPGTSDMDSSAGQGSQADSGEPDAHDLANPEDCRSQALRVEFEGAASTHPAGDPLPIEVTVANTGPVPCLVDLGRQSMQIEVTSGEDGIWTSAECAGGDEARALLLDIDARVQHTVTWNGQRCGSDEEARAGTYRISVDVPGRDGSAQAERVVELT